MTEKSSVPAVVEKPKPYIPSKESVAFIAFIRASGNEELPSPEIHYRMGDLFFSDATDDWNALIKCCRGVGKSTVSEYLVIYVAALGYWPNFGKCPFMVFLGASAEGNVKQFFGNLANKIENSEFLRSVLRVEKKTDKAIALVNADGVRTDVVGKGMNVNWRGARSDAGDRPSVLLADDILHNDSATSQVIRDTIENNWFASAIPALKTRHKKVLIGTPISEDDLIHKLQHSGTYSIVEFPLCDKFPVEREEYNSVWPENFTFDYARKVFAEYKTAGRTQLFYQEYMLSVVDRSTLLVPEENIRWYDGSTAKKYKHKYNVYIVTDFAVSSSATADYSTIGVFGINSNNDWVLLAGQCKRQSMQENIDDLFRYVKAWGPMEVGIETSGQQAGFISILEEAMLNHNVWFSFARKKGSKEPGIRPTRDKLSRFVKGVAPKFSQRKVLLPKVELTKSYDPDLYALVVELESELSNLTLAGGVKKLKHDDAIDLLNQLSEIDTFAPSADVYEGQIIHTDDGPVWAMDFDFEENDGSGGSTVF